MDSPLSLRPRQQTGPATAFRGKPCLLCGLGHLPDQFPTFIRRQIAAAGRSRRRPSVFQRGPLAGELVFRVFPALGAFAACSVHALKITVELAVARIIRLGALQAITIWCACGISRRNQRKYLLERRGTLGDPWRDSLGVVQTPKVDPAHFVPRWFHQLPIPEGYFLTQRASPVRQT